MNSFENQQHQLETKLNNRISERLAKPPEDEVNASNEPLMAWTHASGQLNPNRDKIFNFSTNILDQ